MISLQSCFRQLVVAVDTPVKARYVMLVLGVRRSLLFPTTNVRTNWSESFFFEFIDAMLTITGHNHWVIDRFWHVNSDQHHYRNSECFAISAYSTPTNCTLINLASFLLLIMLIKTRCRSPRATRYRRISPLPTVPHFGSCPSLQPRASMTTATTFTLCRTMHMYSSYDICHQTSGLNRNMIILEANGISTVSLNEAGSSFWHPVPLQSLRWR